MAIEITALSDLDTTSVRQAQVELAQLMSEFNPSIDTKRGPLFDILFRSEAVFAAKNSEEINRLKRSQSLLEAVDDPDLADDEIVDAAASNFRVERRSGSAAEGEITIVVSTQTPVTIASGAIFEANGHQYTTENSFSAKLSQAQVASENDRVLNPVGDGTFSFTIDVVAITEGSAAQAPKDTLFSMQNPPLSFVKAFAASDFSGGNNAETNEDLLGRLLEGVACKALSGTSSMKATLIDEDNFPDVIASSIIGLGDKEMLRDQHSIFPGSLGGRIDWYVRTQQKPQRIALTKTATLVDVNEDGFGIWQFGVSRDDMPGFYDVSKIILQGSSAETGFAVTSDVRSADLTALSDGGLIPDIDPNTFEFVYSRFQSAVIQFEDTTTDVSSLTVGTSTQTYEVTLRGMPLIEDIQDLVSSRSVQNRAADALIKAPVPCDLSVSFDILLKPGQSSPDLSQIKDDIVELVNTYGFTGRLPASAISDAVHDSLSSSSYLSAIDILAVIRRPDGTFRALRTTEILEIPEEPAKMVTARTVGFILDPEDVAISILTADIPEV